MTSATLRAVALPGRLARPVSTAHSATILGGIMLVAALLYVQAASGPAQWADGGFFLVRAAAVPFAELPNDALSHPLYHLYLSVLVAAVGPAWACYGNATLSVAVLPLIFLGARRLGGGPIAAGLAAASYALALPTAFLATRNEVYPLHALTLAAAMLVMLQAAERRTAAWMFGAGLALGVTVLVHQMSLIAILCSLVALAITFRTFRWRLVAAYVAGLSVAGLLTIGQIALADRPESVAELWDGMMRFLAVTLDATGEESYAGAFFNIPDSLANRGPMLVALFSFCGVMTLGAWTALRSLGEARPVQALVAWPALGLAAFCLFYDVSDKFTFALPALVTLSMLAGPAVERLGRRGTVAVPLVAMQPMLGIAAALLAFGGVAFPLQPDTVPYRNNISFWLAPLLRDDSAARFATNYAAVVPPGATVLADYVPRQALRSAQLGGRFLDRHIVADVAQAARHGARHAYVPRGKNLVLDPACLTPAEIGQVLDVACQHARPVR